MHFYSLYIADKIWDNQGQTRDSQGHTKDSQGQNRDNQGQVA